MTNYLILLTPVLIILIVAAFGFTGCTTFTSAPEPEPAPGSTPPGQTGPTTPPVVPPPDPGPTPVTKTYADVVSAVTGFAALWPLNETAGNQTSVVSTSLNPAANGVYYSRPGLPAGSGYALGADGVLIAKESADRAPEFNGQGAWVEVQHVPTLNTANNVAFTVELWVKPNPTSVADNQVLVSSHRFDSPTAEQGYEIRLVRDPNQVNHEIRARVFANGKAVTETKILPNQGQPDAWRHIVFIYKPDPTAPAARNGLVTLHVRLAGSSNGFQDGPHGTFYENVVPANPSTLRFGAGHAGGQNPDRFLAGRIDNVAFYNGELSQADIDKHFAML